MGEGGWVVVVVVVTVVVEAGWGHAAGHCKMDTDCQGVGGRGRCPSPPCRCVLGDGAGGAGGAATAGRCLPLRRLGEECLRDGQCVPTKTGLVCRYRRCGRSETSSVHSAHEGPRPRLHTPIESVYVKQALYYLLMGLAIVGLLLALNAYLRCFRPPATPTLIPRPLPPCTPSLDAPPPYASIQPPSYEQATRGRRHSFSGRGAEAEGLVRGGVGLYGATLSSPLVSSSSMMHLPSLQAPSRRVTSPQDTENEIQSSPSPQYSPQLSPDTDYLPSSSSSPQPSPQLSPAHQNATLPPQSPVTPPSSPQLTPEASNDLPSVSSSPQLSPAHKNTDLPPQLTPETSDKLPSLSSPQSLPHLLKTPQNPNNPSPAKQD